MNIVNKALIPTLVLLSYSGVSLAAQAFDGLNMDVGAGLAAAETSDIWNAIEYYGGYAQDKTKLSIGFSKSMANHYNIAANAFYMPNQTKLGYGSSQNLPNGTDVPLKLSQTFGLVIEPGYYLEKNTLAFLKAGYARSAMKFNDNNTYRDYGEVDGFVYGLGLKHKIDSNIYLGMEAQRIVFANQHGTTTGTVYDTKMQPRTSYFGLNLGYTFSDTYEAPTSYMGSDFDGPYLQAGLGFANYHVHSDRVLGGYNDGMHMPQMVLSAGYSQSFAHRLNLALNLFNNLRDERVNYQEYDEMTTVDTIWGLSLEPGYNLSETALAYLKFGAAKSTLKYSDDGNYPLEYGRIQGLLYGAGYKHAFKDDFYVGFEGYRIAFGKTDWSLNPASSLGLGKAKLNYNFVGLTVGYTI